jgi:hypothetical protein
MQSPRCQPCIDQTMFWLGGTAALRGRLWAQRVAQLVPVDRPWPPYEGRCAELARKQVAGICSDDGRIEALARACHARAAEAWEQIRATAGRDGR